MDEELYAYVKEGESFRQDFKRTPALENTTSLAKHLTAFSNRRGGRLIFGITDEGQLEGASIEREEATNKISNVARDRCDPPVRFTSEFYADQRDGDTVGDVLIVHIESYDLTPHAVLARESRATRTYYLRTGEESREITDSLELRSLFISKPEQIKEYQCETWTVFEYDTYEFIDLRPFLSGPRLFREFYRGLTDEDIEFIKSHDWTEDQGGTEAMKSWPASEDSTFGRALQEVAPFVLFRHLGGSHSTFWINPEKTDRIDRERFESKTETIHISEDVIDFENNPEILDDLSYSQYDLISWGEPLQVPRGTKVIIGFPSNDREYSRVLLQKGDYFEIELGFFRGRHHSILGLPLGYPGYVEKDSDPMAEGFTIALEARFGFPDIEDRDIELHQTFADGWITYLQDHWDWSAFVDQTPDRAIFDIVERLDDIEALLTCTSAVQRHRYLVQWPVALHEQQFPRNSHTESLYPAVSRSTSGRVHDAPRWINVVTSSQYLEGCPSVR